MKFFAYLFIWIFFVQLASAGKLLSVTVKTRAPENREVKIYYRVPKNYDPQLSMLYRVLVVFGGRNCSGQSEAGGRLGFGEWADNYNIFLVAPGFKNDEYWNPSSWSGKALVKALKQIKREYNICDEKLLFYGYSGGSQCSNLFPAWRPGWARAWVSHACGVFHKPTSRMAESPGLITCGDADIMRYIISRHFVEQYRKKGVRIIWKSFPNHPHDVPPDSLKLARVFLTYYHLHYLTDLKRGPSLSRPEPEEIKYVGDDQERRFWEAGTRQAKRIDPEDRVEFPCKELALAWGTEAKRSKTAEQ